MPVELSPPFAGRLSLGLYDKRPRVTQSACHEEGMLLRLVRQENTHLPHLQSAHKTNDRPHGARASDLQGDTSVRVVFRVIRMLLVARAGDRSSEQRGRDVGWLPAVVYPAVNKVAYFVKKGRPFENRVISKFRFGHRGYLSRGPRGIGQTRFEALPTRPGFVRTRRHRQSFSTLL